MPHRLQCCSSSSEGEHGNEDALCINGTPPAADKGEQPAFMPLAPVVGTDGATYESFGAYIASMPLKNCHVVPDKRFQRIVRILQGESTPKDSIARLKREREKPFNTRELGPKAPDGMRLWAPSAWFRVEADLIDMTEQPTRSEGKTYQYILHIIDQKTLFTLLAPLQTKTAAEVSKHLYR